MEFWKKWLHMAAAFILVLSLLSPAAVMAETEELLEQTGDVLQKDDSNESEEESELGSEQEIELGETTGHITNVISGIELNPSGILPLKVGETQHITATVLYESTTQDTATVLYENTTQDAAVIVWNSSDASVATVIDGFVTAVGAGTAIITASVDGVTATLEVQVSAENMDYRALAMQAMDKGKSYLFNNSEQISLSVNGSHSGFWLLAAMYGLGVDVANYPWATSPTAEGTYWTKSLDKASTDSNELAGTIIGAKLLGLDPTNLKNRNQIEDLLKIQREDNMFSTIWGETFAMIALELTDVPYDQQAHIEAVLKLQNPTTGYFGWGPDLEATGWTLFALAPHKDQPAVKAAIDKAVAGYQKTFHEKGFTDNANSMAAIISGLASVGEDVFSDKWTYEKDGKKVNIVGHLVEKYQLEDGSFKWFASQSDSNKMATEQVFLALADAVHGKSTFVRLKEESQLVPPVEPNPDPNPGEGEGGEPEKPTAPVTGTATMSITISSSEVVLPSEQFEILADETAFEFLKRVTTEKQIPLNYRYTSMGNYVIGIAGVNEFERGPLSGWMYRVNGTFPGYSADSYRLASGDYVEWVYTEDLGEDVGGDAGNFEDDIGKEQKPDPDPELDPELEKPADPTDLNTPNNEKIEIPVEEGLDYLQAKLTNEQISADGKSFVIQHKNGTTVELPSAALTLADDETAIVTVQQTEQRIDIQLSASVKEGAAKDIALGKAYAKVTIPAPQATAKTVVLQEVNGVYRAVPHQIVNGEIILFVKASGSFVLVEESITFEDIQNTASQEAIELLASRHIIKGKEDGTFAPDESVTRAQFAAIISRALGLQATESSKFEDTQGKWYEQDVQALFEAGITNGVTTNTFDPNAEITSQQANVFMARILQYVNDGTTKLNNNETIALLNEFEQTLGNTTGSLTRGQTVELLQQLLKTTGLM